MKIISKYIWKFLTILSLVLVIFGFFYFEVSTTLRVMVILLGLIGLIYLSSMSEILMLLILYLGLYDLYNIRYGLAIPLALIILIVFGLATLIFYLESHFNKLFKEIEKNIFFLYLLSIGLIVLEIFLTMSFWPVDPKLKSLVIVVVFYILSRIFYLYINNVLNLKKAIVFILVSVLILGAVLVFNLIFGF